MLISAQKSLTSHGFRWQRRMNGSNFKEKSGRRFQVLASSSHLSSTKSVQTDCGSILSLKIYLMFFPFAFNKQFIYVKVPTATDDHELNTLNVFQCQHNSSYKLML